MHGSSGVSEPEGIGIWGIQNLGKDNCALQDLDEAGCQFIRFQAQSPWCYCGKCAGCGICFSINNGHCQEAVPSLLPRTTL